METPHMKHNDPRTIRTAVRRYYAMIASKGEPSCGCAPSPCCGGDTQTPEVVHEAERLGYTRGEILEAPEGSHLGLGCGNPTAIASLKSGETVLDLGSGAGFDCFLAAKQIGAEGSVIGVDMTPKMIQKAEENALRAGYRNVEFRLGEIEHLPVTDNSVDVVISNCVINLSPDKPAVFREAFRVVKPGGRLAISDIVATAEMPAQVKENEQLYCGCVSGAASIEELHKMLSDAGFEHIKISPVERSKEFIRDWATEMHIDDFVTSAYIEAFKPQRGRTSTQRNTKEYFDDVATQWDRMREGFFPTAVREKAIAAAGVRPGSLAADIGAGSGFLTEELLQRGATVIAIDQSEAMLNVMKQKYGATGKVSYRVGESERLPVDSESLDAAFANMYLHHVEHPPRAIKEMARILKPGGKLVITDCDEHNFEFLRAEQHDRWMGFKREDIRSWFTEAGLKEVVVDCVGDTCCATSSTGTDRASISIFLAVGTK